MDTKAQILSAVAFYDRFLGNIRKAKLPPNYPLPRPSAQWPIENRALLERYLVWLIADDTGQQCITQYFLPIGGHVLGYHLQSHDQIDLDASLERVVEFLQAKQYCERSLVMGYHGLNKFRRFMLAERGLTPQIVPKPANVKRYHVGLPHWLVEQLTHYQHIRQGNWRQARLQPMILRFWSGHTQLWRWLFANHEIEQVADVKRAHIFAYIDERLAAGYSPNGINQDLRGFQATLRFLQERDFVVPRVLLNLPGLKVSKPLPRFLTDEQVALLQIDMEQRVQAANAPAQRRNALLDRAAFYLMWQGGLRLAEVEELLLDDLNLTQQQIVIRQGKGRKDRAVYLTELAAAAVQAYLHMRGDGSTRHLFLYRHKPLSKDLIRSRIKAAGQRCGVKVTPHQLRHTFATQLVNAGCRITTIQSLLGHSDLKTTMTYARVYDRVAADDYYAAMTVVEQRLEPYLHRLQSAKKLTVSRLNTKRLLQLVDIVDAEPLTATQETEMGELRLEIETLVMALDETASSNGHVVKVPVSST